MNPATTHKSLFITGIGTDVGKTVASAVLVKALGYAYWKPIQCGDLESGGDKATVHGLTACRTFPETHGLEHPMSPHAAAELAQIRIHLSDFIPPTEPTIVEGAGGLLVPLNEQHTMADLASHLDLPLVVVSRHYLGSIHHTLSTLEVARNRNLKIGMVIFIGNEPSSERIIRKHANLEHIIRIPELDNVNPKTVEGLAQEIRTDLLHCLSQA